MQIRSIESPSTSIGLIVDLFGCQNPGESASSLKISCPSFVSQMSLFIIINLIAHLFTVILLIVVPWNQSYIIELGSAKIDIGFSFSVWCVLNSDDDTVALTMITEVLSGTLWEFSPSAVFNIPGFQTLRDSVRLLVSIYSAQINLFWTIEGQVESLILTYPVDSSKDGIISSWKVDLQIQISWIDAMI